nr:MULTISPECIES: LysR family transcriptional regulator [Limnobacter]
MSLRQLNFHHLYYFWSVAKEGNLTRTAEALHVSQSALSAQIKQLEEQLQEPLFERTGRALKLTESGQLVLNYAESIFNLGSEMLANLQRGGSDSTKTLRVGAVATLSRNFQEGFLKPVIGINKSRLILESAGLEELLSRLKVHKLDVILSNNPVQSSEEEPWLCRRIARQSVCLVGSPRPPAKSFKFPRDLRTLNLLVPGNRSDIRHQFDLLCENLGLNVTIYAEVDDMAMLRLLARDSAGVALVPEIVVKDELEQGILQKYCELPQIFENFYAITAKRQFRPPLLDQLLGAYQEVIAVDQHAQNLRSSP